MAAAAATNEGKIIPRQHITAQECVCVQNCGQPAWFYLHKWDFVARCTFAQIPRRRLWQRRRLSFVNEILARCRAARMHNANFLNYDLVAFFFSADHLWGGVRRAALWAKEPGVRFSKVRFTRRTPSASWNLLMWGFTRLMQKCAWCLEWEVKTLNGDVELQNVCAKISYGTYDSLKVLEWSTAIFNR